MRLALSRSQGYFVSELPPRSPYTRNSKQRNVRCRRLSFPSLSPCGFAVRLVLSIPAIPQWLGVRNQRVSMGCPLLRSPLVFWLTRLLKIPRSPNALRQESLCFPLGKGSRWSSDFSAARSWLAMARVGRSPLFQPFAVYPRWLRSANLWSPLFQPLGVCPRWLRSAELWFPLFQPLGRCRQS